MTWGVLTKGEQATKSKIEADPCPQQSTNMGCVTLYCWFFYRADCNDRDCDVTVAAVTFGCLFPRERSWDALGANGSTYRDRSQNVLGASG
jgi:hypothetical protein